MFYKKKKYIKGEIKKIIKLCPMHYVYEMNTLIQRLRCNTDRSEYLSKKHLEYIFCL